LPGQAQPALLLNAHLLFSGDFSRRLVLKTSCLIHLNLPQPAIITSPLKIADVAHVSENDWQEEKILGTAGIMVRKKDRQK
jgi:hypothetical protein